MPLYALGMRTEPPWSPPTARSTAPAATSAALPLDEPPAERVGSHGLRTGPVRDVWLPPEKQRSSHTALPMIVAPAASRRVTTVASRVGTKPSRVSEPFIIGTPATMMLSLIATVRPDSGPSSVSWIAVVTYQAPSGLSASAGRDHGRSAGGAGAVRSYSSSTAVHESSRPVANGANDGDVGGAQAEPVALGDGGQVGLVGRTDGHGGPPRNWWRDGSNVRRGVPERQRPPSVSALIAAGMMWPCSIILESNAPTCQ